ncbi:cytochrome c-type biogenesis protein [Salinisphaera sp. SPP-AMP-43]|uniref:cytochrome c-type biogenesis protein n=1 Tax=Salinisphaera sp. SPP-AMP-43 TaxID=3121288 RepID=UPI003C6E7238
MRLRWPVFCLWIVLCLVPMARAEDGSMTEAEAQRYHVLTERLRCLVCQNQSIATSDADLAADLRERVANQIRAGRTDTEIRRYMADRYGDWVLYRPPFNRSTWALWLAPLALLLCGLGCIARLLGRRSRGRSMAPAERDRLAAILERESDQSTRSSSTGSADDH